MFSFGTGTHSDQAVGVAAGGALPVALLLVPDAPELWAIGAAASLVGLFVEQDTLVRAGQALAIS